MSLFKIDNRTLRLLGAQVNLSETFNHVLRTTAQREVLPFRLQVDRAPATSTFTIEIGRERHSLVLQNDKKTHLKLADFIEEIANGSALMAAPLALGIPHASRQYGSFTTDQLQQVFELVCTGGTVTLEAGFDLPIHLAIHRNGLRSAFTVIVSIGVKQPRTQCFTARGSAVELYEKVANALLRIADAATPAAHAA
jgi:hypothetical protein